MKDIRVVVVGAGMAGILAGIKLQEKGIGNIAIYEKADRIGGTWRENTYPGLTCDVPSHHYTYSFERNPDWSRHLPPGPEIQNYFERVTKKYGVDKLIRFNTEITRANFKNGRWQLTLAGGETDHADVIIAATGVLHMPRYPNIKGMDDFQGAMFHTARWDHSVPLQGKRIGVVGMGSTGVQIVSALADKVELVEHFVRTPQWIMPVENGYYSEEQKALFRNDPAALEAYMDIDNYNAGIDTYSQCLTEPDSEVARSWHQLCYDNLDNSVRDPALREQLRPDHMPLCKRLIFSPNYYESIQQPTARLVRSDIDCIEAKGIRTADGELHELDVIALATGFRTDRFMRPMQITGRNGVSLENYWTPAPKAYLAISMPDFPNLFMLNGPNGPVGNFSLIDIAEHQWRYIDQLLERLLAGECTEITPTQEATDSFNAERVKAAKKTVWYTGGCNSWYLDAEGIPASWPWNFTKFVDEMKSPNFGHYRLAG